jgi:hypothetical protein
LLDGRPQSRGAIAERKIREGRSHGAVSRGAEQVVGGGIRGENAVVQADDEERRADRHDQRSQRGAVVR